MEKIKQTIDKVVHPDRHNTTTSTGSTNAGPHDSNALNKADPRVDSDLDGGRHAGLNQTTGTHGTTGLTGSHGTTGTGLTGTTHGSTNAGPHNSNALNKADPRVDSDLDGGRHAGLNQTTGTHGSTGLTGTHGTHGTHGTTGSGLTGTSGIGSSGANTTAGPHSSDMMNKLDPRVDSDLSGGHMGSNQQYTHTGTTGSSGLTGSSTTHGSSGLTGSNTYGSTTAGPHSSNLANKADPRVDSDLSGGHMGSNQQYTHTGTTGSGLTGSSGTGLTGSHAHGSTNAGPHSSNFANSADPRVDSDLDGSRNAGLNQTTHGSSGLGSNTAGNTQPVHNSNLLNKLDPRVNTGSGTTGSSNTY